MQTYRLGDIARPDIAAVALQDDSHFDRSKHWRLQIDRSGWARINPVRTQSIEQRDADVVGSRGQPLIGRVVQGLGEKLRRADLDQPVASGWLVHRNTWS
jgi:hypothetical protein